MTNKSDELIDRLGKRLAQEGPAASRLSLAALWAAAPLVLMAIPLVLVGLRSDVVAGSTVDGYWLYVSALAVLSVGAFYDAWLSGIPARQTPLWLRVVLAGACASVLGGIALMARQGLVAEPLQEGLAGWGWHCTRTESLLVIVPACVFFVLFRKLAATRPARSGALGMLALGSLAALVLALHCASNNPLHIVLWHFVPVAVLIAAGAALGGRILRW